MKSVAVLLLPWGARYTYGKYNYTYISNNFSWYSWICGYVYSYILKSYMHDVEILFDNAKSTSLCYIIVTENIKGNQYMKK